MVEKTTHTVVTANDFIQANKDKVDFTFKPEVHFTAPIGWINDPNGFVYFRGEYHLFYQFYPQDSVWGPMHWGHAKTKDFITWEHLPVALAPDQDYDKDGCFSGSAIVKDDRLWLMYTGNIINEDGSGYQIQNMAYSDDGIHFQKYEGNPVATGDTLPDELVVADFRDPKLFEKDGRYYSVVAAKHKTEVGCIVLLSSDDLMNWEFESIFLKGTPEQGFMWECPDYFELDGKSYLVFSPMRYKRDGNDFVNINSSVIVEGTVDWDAKTFTAKSFKEIDHGHDFYAPQSLEDDKGRRIVIAWMHTWGRTVVPEDMKHKWAGQMSLPRVLTRDEQGNVRQNLPKETLEALAQVEIGQEITVGRIQVATQTGQSTILRLGTEEDYIEFGYATGEVYIDRSHLAIKITGEEEWDTQRRAVTTEAQSLLIVFDKNTLEIFVDEGRESLTSTFFINAKHVLSKVEE